MVDDGRLNQPSTPAAGLVRGSSLLLGGKFISVGLSLLVQILIVRYLSQADYGGFAFALAAIALAANVGLFGMDKTLSRFLPIYDERGDSARAAGALLLAAGTVAVTGAITVGTITVFDNWLDDVLIHDELATSLLVILAPLAPVLAADSLAMSTFAVLNMPRAILVRRHIVQPLLQLVVVSGVIGLQLGVTALALGYVIASVVGLVVFGAFLMRLLIPRGWLAGTRDQPIRVPGREMVRFTAPLMSSDLIFLLTAHLVVIFLQVTQAATDVAVFRAVLPLAQQNLLVASTVFLLFLPVASRTYARREIRSLNELYWQSTVWTTILTFPIFLLTFLFAKPLSETLFGSQYAASGLVLAWLSVGYYLVAAFGFSSYLLRVYGRVRYVVVTDLVTVAVGIPVTIALVMAMGPAGGAMAVTVVLVLNKVLLHAGLRALPGIELFPRRYITVYAGVAGVPVAIVAMQQLFQLPIAATLTIGLMAAVGLPLAMRGSLNLAEFFPEAGRIPLIGSLFR